MTRKKQSKSSGQAIVEFALILTVLLLMIFLIIESARILQAWITVQNAAREGARYAITGINDPACSVTGLPKFSQYCSDLRLSSIIDRAHTGLAGLRLDENSTAFEDDYYYQIEVWGVNSSGQLQPYFGGVPNTPVVVRAFYRVPIITPLLNPIIDSVPVFGQATMTNESFGQLGNASQGSGVPPALPPVPTAGVTPSPMPSPTPTDTPTVGPTPTGTATPTNTATATPAVCATQFEGSALEGFDFVFVTGEIGSTVTIVNLSTGEVLGTAVLQAFNGHACPGFNDFSGPGARFADPLTGGDILLAQSSDGTFDTTIVRAAPPTPTPTSTNTPVPTSTSTPTPSITPTATPSGPFITLLPNCTGNTSAQIQILGANWPINVSISLYWDGTQLITTIPPSTSQFFSRSYTATGLDTSGSTANPVTYDVVAIAATGETYTAVFSVPCAVPPTPTPTVLPPTATPEPADLVIVGPPTLVSTPPIIAYQPVQFSMLITNTGEVDVSDQFFIDLYFDPANVVSVTTSIPISESSGYMGVSSLAGKSSLPITITAQLGFQNNPANHAVYGMVDSVFNAMEDNEDNNLSTPTFIDFVTPAAATPTPTPAATISGTNDISGIVNFVVTDPDTVIIPQFRAVVKLKDSGNNTIAVTTAGLLGDYTFPGVGPGTYSVVACVTINNKTYANTTTGVTPPTAFADVWIADLPSFEMSCPQ